VPEGTILNPTRFAATGIRYTTALRISDVVMGALSQAVPERIPAAGAGQFGLLTLSDLEPESGTYVVHVLEPLQGGSGGRPGKDGIDGMNFSGGALRNAPVEALELDSPIFVSGYMLNDAVAPGRWRGGSGILLEFQLLSRHAQISSRGWDRFHFRPWGREGGAGGTLGSTSIIDEAGRSRSIPKIEVLRLAPGETVRIVSPGGGGYGDPLQRQPEAVLRDVEDGFVTVEEARRSYGVVIAAGAVDADATAAERKRRTADPRTARAFEIGDERRAYEQRLPEAFQDLVERMLASEPASSRLYLRDVIYERCFEEGHAALDEARIRSLIDSLQVVATQPALGRLGRLGKPAKAG